MGDKGEGWVKYLKNWVTSFMDDPIETENAFVGKISLKFQCSRNDVDAHLLHHHHTNKIHTNRHCLPTDVFAYFTFLGILSY